MILENMSNWRKYEGLHKNFGTAFRYIESLHGKLPAEKRIELDGSSVYVLPMTMPGKGRDAARLEAHRKYIDIQYVMQGKDVMGWKPIAACKEVTQAYSAEKDIEFFGEKPDAWFDVVPGDFAVFFPEDAHAPLAGSGEIVKIVVKLAV